MGEETSNEAESTLDYQITSLLERLEALRARGTGGVGGDGRGAAAVAARVELRSVQLWRAVAAECVASFLYVFVVCGAAGGAGVGASTSSVLLATALASGCAVTALTLCFSHISGAHVNPAVSAALCVRRLVSPLRAALYVAAQCGGAIAGAALLYGVTVPGHQGNLQAALSAWGAPAAWERLGAELVLTALVVGAHLAAADTRRVTYSAPAAAAAPPLALGAAYCACSLVSMPYLNPARSLGPAFVLSRWEQHWVYWLGPLAGSLAAALLHELAVRPPRARSSRAAASASPSASPAASDYDEPPPHHHHHPPRDHRAPEPLYAGTKSLYCRSPPLTRANLHRSQSVYSKAGAAPPPSGPLLPAQSLYPMRIALNLAHNQNAHNASRATREGAYGAVASARPACSGAPPAPAPPPPPSAPAPAPRRPDSVYGVRRGPSLSAQSDDSSYGSYAPPQLRHAHY